MGNWALLAEIAAEDAAVLGNGDGQIMMVSRDVMGEFLSPSGHALRVVRTSRASLAIPVCDQPFNIIEFPPWVEKENNVTLDEIEAYNRQHLNDPEPTFTSVQLNLHRRHLGTYSIAAAFSSEVQVWAVNPNSLRREV